MNDDMTKPCLCGCGQEVSGYYTDSEGIGWKSQGLMGGYADDSCIAEARSKAIKQETDSEGLPTFRDIISGAKSSEDFQTQYRLTNLKRAKAKAEMLEDKHRAKEIDSQITAIQGNAL